MDEAEFDQFAAEYDAMHRDNIKASGEGPEFFARYKIADMVQVWDRHHPETSPQHILDFGGGIGASAPHLSELFPTAKITLADVSKRSLEIAEARAVPRINTMLFDGSCLPIENCTVDMGMAACVFHHIPAEKHVALLRDIYRVLVPGGLFFIFEHNPWNPLTQHVVNTCPFDENAVLIAGPEMKRRMCEAGFDTVKLSWRIFFPGALRALRPLERWLETVPLGAQYRLVGQK